MNWVLKVPREPSEQLPDGTWDSDTLAHVQQNFRQYGLLVNHDDPRVLTHALNDMESPEIARDLFLAYEGLAAGSVGSHRVYSVSDREILEQVQIAMHATCRLARTTTVNSIPSATQAIHLPSSWHAALWLTLRQLEARQDGRHVAFRGQASPSWNLTPSWPRVVPARQSLVLRQRSRFESIVSEIAGRLGFTMDTAMCRAASQHHGLTSRLLDFTTDPLIAIWFALDLEGSSDQPHRAVWYRDIASLHQSGCRFVLAPPFLRRLHAQRGFFIHRRARAAPLSPRMHLIVFDWLHETEGHFEPVWLGESTPVYPAVKWLETLALEVANQDDELYQRPARKALTESIFELAQHELEGSLARGEYAVSEDRVLPLFDGPWTEDTHSGLAYDALYRLAFVTEHREGTRGHRPLIQSIVSNNPTIIHGLVKAIETPPDGLAVAKADQQLAKLLRDMLSE